MKTFVDVTSMKASLSSAKECITLMKASMEALVEVTSMEAFTEDYGSSHEITCGRYLRGSFHIFHIVRENFHGSFHKDFRGSYSYKSFHNRRENFFYAHQILYGRFVNVTSIGAFGKTFVKSPVDVYSVESFVYFIYLVEAPTEAFTKTSVEFSFMKATTTSTKVFITSMKVFIEALVDVDSMKVPLCPRNNIYYTDESFSGSFRGSYFHGRFRGSFRGSSRGIQSH